MIKELQWLTNQLEYYLWYEIYQTNLTTDTTTKVHLKLERLKQIKANISAYEEAIKTLKGD